MTSSNKTITVALAGNPNSGKTSLFNQLVHANQKVGNFSGVTVEKVEGVTKYKDYTIKIIDLPGTYSLSAYSPEEVLARNYIIENKPDVVINVIDATNFERNLFLSMQLIELDSKFLIALNMFDEVLKQGDKIKVKQLQTLLGSHVVPTSAKRRKGIEILLDHVVRVFHGEIIPQNKISYPQLIEENISKISEVLNTDKELSEKYPVRWLAIKLLENDKIIYKLVKESPIWIKVFKLLLDANSKIEVAFKDDSEIVITERRLSFIRGALQETLKKKQKTKLTNTEILDKILINKVTGIPIFLFFMWTLFQLVFKIGQYPMHWLESFFVWMGNGVSSLITNPTAESIIVDGIIGGVGGVLVFLPNIMLLFLGLAFFEGSGYMARSAFVVDRVMHFFGLHGKSAISMITGFGCSIPAFMSTRTLKSTGDRITTLLIIPFMSCGAKLPVFILIIGAFFNPDIAGNMLFAVYLFGIFVALFSAKFFKATLFKGESEPFVMELPTYRWPSLRSLLFQMWNKASLYLKKAATIILLASVLIWLGGNFPQDSLITKEYKNKIELIQQNSKFSDLEKEQKISILIAEEDGIQIKHSIIGKIGKAIEPVIKPLGFDWRIGISLVTGIAAKEIVISTMGTLYSIGNVESKNTVSLSEKLRNENNYNLATAISLLIFVLLYIPCIAASIVFHREAGKWKWTFVYIFYSMSIAWVLAFAGYQITSLFI
ncbi:MAG: ferrous iron transport protein B [Bacteroidota bacterium]|nr:ferrous iron transport protein B [Bacteroidota bacterium]